MTEAFLGIEIGGTKLQLVIGDATGRIRERRRLDVDRQAAGAGIRQQIERTLPGMVRTFHPAALAVGFGGPVDRQHGRIACSHQIEGWADFPLHDWLSQLASLPVVLDNDANMAALGEATCGAGRDFNPVFYVTLGSGVGGGLVVDGRIYHGTAPGEVEIGHVRLDRTGTIVEARCSGWAVDRKIQALKTAGGTGRLCDLAAADNGNEARHLAPALTAGDPAAQQILDETATDLALALSHVVHLLHPQVLVLGGGLSLVGEPLRAAVAIALPGFVMAAFQPVPAVRLAGLGEDAVPVGCLVAASIAIASRSLSRPAAVRG